MKNNPPATIEGTDHENSILEVISCQPKLMVSVTWQLNYDSNSEDYFPRTASLVAHNMVKIDINPKEQPNSFEFGVPLKAQDDNEPAEDGKLEVGMIGILEPKTYTPYPQEEFLIEITKVSDGGRKAFGQVIKPSNIPVCPERWSLDHNFLFKNKQKLQKRSEDTILTGMSILGPDRYKNHGTLQYSPPWPGIMTLVSLEIPYDFQLDENTWIIKLTDADRIEIRQYLSEKGHMPYNDITHAICFKSLPSKGVREASQDLVAALRLFKPGYIETGLDFTFEANYFEFSTQDKPPYIEGYTKLQLLETDIEEFKNWVATFNSSPIDPNSLMARALARFERTYYKAEAYERITDGIIGLELLLAPIQAPEISYRVAQRASFVFSDDPASRLSETKWIKEAYSIRSSAVHAGKPDSKATEKRAKDSQDLLRGCIRKIFEADKRLRDEFCELRKDHKSINEFYETLINFGKFQAATEYWKSNLKS